MHFHLFEGGMQGKPTQPTAYNMSSVLKESLQEPIKTLMLLAIPSLECTYIKPVYGRVSGGCDF